MLPQINFREIDNLKSLVINIEGLKALNCISSRLNSELPTTHSKRNTTFKSSLNSKGNWMSITDSSSSWMSRSIWDSSTESRDSIHKSLNKTYPKSIIPLLQSLLNLIPRIITTIQIPNLASLKNWASKKCL